MNRTPNTKNRKERDRQTDSRVQSARVQVIMLLLFI